MNVGIASREPVFRVKLLWASLCLLVVAFTALTLLAAQAKAAPGAYRVLISEPYPDGAKELQAQITAFPDVATVDLVNTGEEGEGRTPTSAELSSYDVVVSIGDSTYLDPEAWGNALAGYVDSGGVVVQAGYDSWEGGGAPTGRFTPGYAPFIPGNNGNNTTSLGSFDASSPLMQGIATLTTIDNTEPELAPGATLIAKWANDKNAIAVKGRVVSVTAWLGDDYGPGEWSGDYGRLVVNAVRTLGRQRLIVTNSNPHGGTVLSSAGGISCGSLCSADFVYQTPVSLKATAKRGFAFAGFGDACTGTSCSLTMDTAKSVSAKFASFKFGRVKLNVKKGTAQLSVPIGAPGKLVVSGRKIKKRSRSAKKAGKVTLPIVPKGNAIKALGNSRKAKVQVKLAFAPAGGSTSTLAKSIQLLLKG